MTITASNGNFHLRRFRMFLSLAGSLFGVVLFAGAASASDDVGHGLDNSLLAWQAVNLIILVAVLVYFSRKPIGEFFKLRRDQIEGDLNASARLLSEAEARNAELQRRLIDLESEVEEIRETTRRRSEEESERILAEARKAAERIRTDATAAVDQELRRAQQELRDEAAHLALDLAGEILKSEISEGDRERLMDEFIIRVEPTTA